MGARKGRITAAAMFAALGLALGTAGCSSPPPPPGSVAAATPSLGEKIQNLVLLGSTNPPPAPPASGPKVEVSCPSVDILPGTGAYQLYVAGHQGDPFNLRYQARFGQFARQCDVAGDQVTIRVGISGRVVVGPKGEAGHTLSVPVRIALLDYDDKPVFSKLTTIAVSIPAGSGGEDFREVIEVPPMAIPHGRLYGWSIKVGFDAKGSAATTPRERHRAHRRPTLRLH
jgi:hypothetical protein